MSIDDLLARGRLEAVPADPSSALERLATARLHLESARRLAEQDPDGAYALLYDAARKAVAAHMLASGIRARNRPGAHETTARYATLALPGGAARELDRLRRSRNRLEYGGSAISPQQVRHDLAHAGGLIAAVEQAWPVEDETPG